MFDPRELRKAERSGIFFKVQPFRPPDLNSGPEIVNKTFNFQIGFLCSSRRRSSVYTEDMSSVYTEYERPPQFCMTVHIPAGAVVYPKN